MELDESVRSHENYCIKMREHMEKVEMMESDSPLHLELKEQQFIVSELIEKSELSENCELFLKCFMARLCQTSARLCVLILMKFILTYLCKSCRIKTRVTSTASALEECFLFPSPKGL